MTTHELGVPSSRIQNVKGWSWTRKSNILIETLWVNFPKRSAARINRHDFRRPLSRDRLKDEKKRVTELEAQLDEARGTAKEYQELAATRKNIVERLEKERQELWCSYWAFFDVCCFGFAAIHDSKIMYKYDMNHVQSKEQSIMYRLYRCVLLSLIFLHFILTSTRKWTIWRSSLRMLRSGSTPCRASSRRPRCLGNKKKHHNADIQSMRCETLHMASMQWANSSDSNSQQTPETHDIRLRLRPFLLCMGILQKSKLYFRQAWLSESVDREKAGWKNRSAQHLVFQGSSTQIPVLHVSSVSIETGSGCRDGACGQLVGFLGICRFWCDMISEVTWILWLKSSELVSSPHIRFNSRLSADIVPLMNTTKAI